MITIIGIIVGFLILMLLVVAHEFGHFIAARRNGVEVEEFGIGFPPRFKAWLRVTDKNGKKHWQKLPKSEWEKPQKSLVFSLNALPIGGFCSMKGESDSDTRKGSFGAASLWAKTKILFAGVVMNWLTAFIILTILAITGMPTFMDNQFGVSSDAHINPATVSIGQVIKGSPAEAAGLKAGDEFLRVGNTEVKSMSDVFDFNDAHAGETVTYLIKTIETSKNSAENSTEESASENSAENPTEESATENSAENSEHTVEKSVDITLNSADSEYILGVYLAQNSLPTTRYTWSAPIVAAANTVQLTGETYRGLGNMVGSLVDGVVKQFSGDESVKEAGKAELKEAGDSVSGPVGIIGVLFPASVESGPTTLAFLAALISISLACMNVLPIPALDGGRFTLIALFRLFGKKLTKETEEKIVSRTFVFLLLLIALVTILDILRFF